MDYMYINFIKKYIQSCVHWDRDQMAMLIKNNNAHYYDNRKLLIVKGTGSFPNCTTQKSQSSSEGHSQW